MEMKTDKTASCFQNKKTKKQEDVWGDKHPDSNYKNVNSNLKLTLFLQEMSDNRTQSCKSCPS